MALNALNGIHTHGPLSIGLGGNVVVRFLNKHDGLYTGFLIETVFKA